jgi:predicted enzyme related to lactoylglutathione lyase
MDTNKNAVGWFEIPVSNMDRAVKFYETVLGYKLSRNKFDKLEMAWFPSLEKPGSSGSLVHHPDFYKPSQDGVLIYFSSSSGDLNNELSKVESASGKILIPKRQVSEEYGYMAVILDTEGNRIALHSAK